MACSIVTNLDSLSAGRGQPDAATLDGRAESAVTRDGGGSDINLVVGQDSGEPGSHADGAPGEVSGGTDGGVPSSGMDADAISPAADALVGTDGGEIGPLDASTTPAVDAGAVDAGGDALRLCPLAPVQSATLELFSGVSVITGCGIDSASLPSYFVAVDATTFAGSAACGGCMRIETPAAVVEALVVEQGAAKTPANSTTIAVNRAALAMLVPDGSTYVDQGVEWRFVPCSLPPRTGMTFVIQPGSSATYAALLILNHRFRIASVEYRTGRGYRSLIRASYNYWVAPNGMGGGPFTFRITDVSGNVVDQAGVPLVPGASFRGDAQFPACQSNG